MRNGRRRWEDRKLRISCLVSDKSIRSGLWFKMPYHQARIHGSSGCTCCMWVGYIAQYQEVCVCIIPTSTLPSCFMFGLKQTLVTVSRCPLKCRSSVGSSCRAEVLIEAHHKQIISTAAVPLVHAEWTTLAVSFTVNCTVCCLHVPSQPWLRSQSRRLTAAGEKGGELEGFKFGANVPISAQPYLSACSW